MTEKSSVLKSLNWTWSLIWALKKEIKTNKEKLFTKSIRISEQMIKRGPSKETVFPMVWNGEIKQMFKTIN